MSTITTSTEAALDPDLLTSIREKEFCIIGCGAVGAIFAEMLVRTGATKIRLIDGDTVEKKNLNRTIGFLDRDIGKEKVKVLAKHLKMINPEIEEPIVEAYHFREESPGDIKTPEVREVVAKSDVIIMAMDSNVSRIFCERLCDDLSKDYLSIGIGVEKAKKIAFYECSWKPKTPESKKGAEGYGTGNGSFASIVMEATAVGFHLMLHHLQHKQTEYKYFYKEYSNFVPVISDKSSTKNNIL